MWKGALVSVIVPAGENVAMASSAAAMRQGVGFMFFVFVSFMCFIFLGICFSGARPETPVGWNGGRHPGIVVIHGLHAEGRTAQEGVQDIHDCRVQEPVPGFFAVTVGMRGPDLLFGAVPFLVGFPAVVSLFAVELVVFKESFDGIHFRGGEKSVDDAIAVAMEAPGLVRGNKGLLERLDQGANLHE